MNMNQQSKPGYLSLTVLLFSAFLTACGGGNLESVSPGATVTGLTHEPASLSFAKSWDARRVVLKAGFDDGSVRDVTASALWSSDDETVATVSAGEVTPVGAGETVIKAAYRGRTVNVPVTAKPRLPRSMTAIRSTYR